MTKLHIFVIIFASLVLGILIFFISAKNISAPNSIDKFPRFNSKFTKTLKDNETTIILTGDVMLGRSVMRESLQKQKDPIYPFRNVSEVLNKADITVINLENPIIKNCPFITGGFKFCADPKMIEGLKISGVDVANLANNHTYNFGKEGFNQTKTYLANSNIDYVGDGNLVIKEINGTKFGFLGLDLVVRNPNEGDFEFIKQSNEKVDVLIVAVHWGVEYKDVPTDNQKIFATKFVDSGADVIYGTHPHWIQTIEHINGKPVYYSLGNFVFDQMWSEETKKGLVVKLTYDGKNLIKEEKIPVYMAKIGQPVLQTTE